MNPPSIEIAGVTLTVNDQGVALKKGWLVSEQIPTADVLKVRDWINANFPEKIK